MDKNTFEAVKKTIEEIPTLTPREKFVLRYRFGLEDGQTHTLQETGKQVGVTRERVRQIEAKCLEAMRTWEGGKLLTPLLDKK